MQQKSFTLTNRGMNRDLSVSKTGESSAYENHNIRIEARDNETLLSVTNERGTKEVQFVSGPSEIVGTVIGWNVLNNHIIIFTNNESVDGLKAEIESLNSQIVDKKVIIAPVLQHIENLRSQKAVYEEWLVEIDENVIPSWQDRLTYIGDVRTSLSGYKSDVTDGTDYHQSYFQSLQNKLDEIEALILAIPSDVQWAEIYNTYSALNNDISSYMNEYVSAVIDNILDSNTVSQSDYEAMELFFEVVKYIYNIGYTDATTTRASVVAHIEDYETQISELETSIATETSNIEELEEELSAKRIEYNAVASTVDKIYRIDYDGENFTNNLVFQGDLSFDQEHPIESIVYFESEKIQKIYWVDGKNVLRFCNFVDNAKIAVNWSNDNTAFDTNRTAKFTATAKIEKNNSGNQRQNGVVQYLLTYFNKHGQETNYTWMSDLVYLSPIGRGGAADETNNNQITITFSNLDTTFTNFRVYSVFRSALDGQTVSYLVHEGMTSSNDVIVTDDGAHLTLQDSNRILYLGSQAVKANTITHKDGTLFLGDLKSIGRASYMDLKNIISAYMFVSDSTATNNWESMCVDFRLSTGSEDIPYTVNSGTYPYNNQLQYTSSEIQTFKGGEKYRFGLKFQLADGSETDAFWIGDKVNPLYPVVDKNGETIHRVIAVCTIPEEVVMQIRNIPEIKTVQLVMAEATYADRSVKAQGIVNPTMFNTWERYQDRLYSMPSWISRPRNSSIANHHFEAVHNASETTGEIACNYWNDESNSHPYFQYANYSTRPEYAGALEGMDSYDLLMIVYRAQCFDEKVFFLDTYLDSRREITAYIITGKAKQGYSLSDLQSCSIPNFPSESWVEDESNNNNTSEYNYETTGVSLHMTVVSGLGRAWNETEANHLAYVEMKARMIDWAGIDEVNIAREESCSDWFPTYSTDNYDKYFSKEFIESTFTSFLNVANATPLADRWISPKEYTGIENGDLAAAKYKKHIIYVDENIITFNSPEIEQQAVSVDNADYKFRIVGVAKMTSNITDYAIDAEQGVISGDDVYKANFSGTIAKRRDADGLISWPLWKDYGLMYDPSGSSESDYKKRKMKDFKRNGNVVGFWIYLWGKAGNITGYYDKKDENADPEDLVFDDHEYSILKHQNISNLHFSYETIYAPNSGFDYKPESLRQFHYTSSQMMRLDVNEEAKYYDGIIDTSLSVPGNHKYPIVYSPLSGDTDNDIIVDDADLDNMLFTDLPVQVQFSSTPHAVIAFHTAIINEYYTQRLLPYIFDSDRAGFVSHTSTLSGALLPWVSFTNLDAGSDEYPYYDFKPLQNAYAPNADDDTQSDFNVPESSGISGLANTLNRDDNYLFIGEIYEDFSSKQDTRYGGITESAVQNCRFISAGPQYPIENFASTDKTFTIVGNQGDTYFQRWDCVRIKPFSRDTVYSVTDIVSFLVETHINIEGRSDLQRGINNITDIDFNKYGSINPVYSQQNNFKVSRQLDEDFSTDSYRSSITWTLQKEDLAEVDEWTHITLAATHKLDGDKGICRALRRFQNSIIALQDKGVSEILFNSRTQLSTDDGVPVEIANSGKVDGKRYISNKYGCTNKWSIAEGKAGLYFVDSINKSFCALTASQQGRLFVNSLSMKLGFSSWFENNNNIEPWTPKDFDNIVSFYDKVHSDVYLVTNNDGNESCLVYNEPLEVFTGFFDYGGLTMLSNVEDRLVSYNRNSGSTKHIWLQNEGLYCNFFGKQYSYWTIYRVAPEPLNDKIWTNVDLQADCYRILNEDGGSIIGPEFSLINLDEMHYIENETFDEIEIWNEYQTTGRFVKPPMKKFRTWRYVIPRAKTNSKNIHGLDRIRNPWINLKLKKTPLENENQDLMQLHDIIVKYFE